VRREVLQNILIEFEVTMILVRLIKMCLNDIYSIVRMGKHLSDSFSKQNGLLQGDALSLLIFNFALEYANKETHKPQVGLKLDRAYQLPAYADDVSTGRQHRHHREEHRNFK
jgi:hypothetical protein